MKIDIITLFPEMFTGPLTESIIKRAQEKGLVEIKTHQLRDWAINEYGKVDDKPYGGGPGMIMRADVAFAALKSVSQKITKSKLQITIRQLADKQIQSSKSQKNKPYIILPTPKGKKFDQAMARRLAKKKHLVFLCPHYEGYDHRIESLVDEKVSIGDYILTGGELPAMVIADAVVRLVPGVISADSLKEESFSDSRRGAPMWAPEKGRPRGVAPTADLTLNLEYPQYTRPEVFEIEKNDRKIKKRVPKVLLSGNHALISSWRRSKSS